MQKLIVGKDSVGNVVQKHAFAGDLSDEVMQKNLDALTAQFPDLVFEVQPDSQD